MKIITISDASLNDEKACAVGNFDGFHKGHLKVLEELKKEANKENLKTTIITFNPHPKEVLLKESPCKITSFETKLEFLKKSNIDFLIIISFDKEFANLSKEEFLKFLKNKIKCKKIVVGKDWRFGKNREGDVEFAINFGKMIGLEVKVINPEKFDKNKISSSEIRKFLKEGKMEVVNELLGRTYCLAGRTVSGNKIGTKIGYPTINIKLEENLCLRKGVYLGFVDIKRRKYKTIMNYGKRPTVDGTEEILEAHILDSFENLKINIDEKIKVYFLHFIRDEKKFENIDELKKQIKKDIFYSEKFFKEGGNAVNI